MPRILVIEDHPKTADALRNGLRGDGFETVVTGTGDGGFALLNAEPFDLVVLDWMLPGRDGLEILTALRARGSKTPVLFKPFAFAELLARIRALLRRTGEAEPLRRQVGNLTVDLETRRVTRGAQEVLLTPREFDLLAYLMRHHGQTVTRQMLAKDVWREPHRATPLDNVIDVHVAHLRRKIDEGQRLTLIHTVRGVGFVLKAEGP